MTLVYSRPDFFCCCCCYLLFWTFSIYIQDEKWKKASVDFGYIRAYGGTTWGHPEKKKDVEKMKPERKHSEQEWESVRLFIFSVGECGQKRRMALWFSARQMLKMWGGIATQAPFNWFLALHFEYTFIWIIIAHKMLDEFSPDPHTHTHIHITSLSSFLSHTHSLSRSFSFPQPLLPSRSNFQSPCLFTVPGHIELVSTFRIVVICVYRR